MGIDFGAAIIGIIFIAIIYKLLESEEFWRCARYIWKLVTFPSWLSEQAFIHINYIRSPLSVAVTYPVVYIAYYYTVFLVIRELLGLFKI